MEDLLSQFKPQAQIVVYASAKEADGPKKNTSYYLEHHDIRIIDGKKTLGEGKPLTRKTIKELLSVVLSSDKTAIATVSRLLPETVLYVDGRPGRNRLVWYTLPQRRLVHIENAKTSKKGMVWFPAMLYAVADDKLYVFAMRTGKTRPTHETKLYYAPLPNVKEENDVCLGDVKKPAKITEITDLISAWERAFWSSDFTGDLTGGKRIKSGEPTNKMLLRLMRTRAKFPISQLVLSGKSLQSIISTL